MDTFQKILVVVFILQAVYNLYERLMGKRGGEPDEVPEPEAVAAVVSDDLVDRIEGHLQELVERADGLSQRTDDLERALGGAKGPAVVVASLVRETIRPAVDGVTARARRLVEGGGTPDQRLQRLRDLMRDVGMVELQVGFTEDLSRWRGDPDLGGHLADADAMAAALLRPLQQFTSAHGIAFPALRPVSVPAAPGMEAVVYGLFPGRPVIFVPDDFVDDLMRWPSLAHEVGHLMWRFLPGFAGDVRDLVPGGGHPWLPHISGRQVVFDVQACFATWLPEIVADAFCVMLMGPTALRGMVHAFAPAQPEEAILATRGGDGNTVGEHPPAHLRVTLVAHLLARMDYPSSDWEHLLQGWDREVEAPTHLLFPTLDGDHVPLPLRRFTAMGRALVDAFYASEYSSLSGYTLRAVHDLELGPGRWARAQRRATQLLANEPFNDDPVVVLAAGIEAAGRAPGSAVRIARGVRRAVLGMGTDEKKVADQAYALDGPTQLGTLTPRDVLEALILRSILHRAHRHPLEPKQGAPGHL